MSEVSSAQTAVFGSLSKRGAPPRQEVDSVKPEEVEAQVPEPVDVHQEAESDEAAPKGRSFPRLTKFHVCWLPVWV